MKLARQREVERTIPPPHHNLTYTVNTRDAYAGPQGNTGSLFICLFV